MLSEAEQHLSVNDRKQISKRSGAEAAALEGETEPSEEEVEPKSKGKGPDPRNWGQLNMNQSDLSEDVQRALLAQWKATKASQKKKPSLKATVADYVSTEDEDNLTRNESSNVRVPVHVQTEGVVPLTGESSGKKKKEWARGENPTEKLIRETLQARNSEPRASVVCMIEPAQQINPASYLGKVLEQAGKKAKPEKRNQPAPSGGGDPGCSDPLDDESMSTFNMSTLDSSESSTDESGNDSSGRRHHHRRSTRKSKKKRHYKKSKKSGYGRLRPIPPEDYDGTPNAQAFS